MILYKNIEWINKHGALIPKNPPHCTIDLAISEQKELLNISNAYFLRWNSSFDINKNNFWYIIKDTFGGMDELSSKMRNQIRKGKKYFYTKQIKYKNFKKNIYSIYFEASKKYDTFENIMNEEEFIKYIDNLDEKKYEFFGVFNKESDKLVAYSQNFISENTCFYEEIFFYPKYAKNYCNYVLIYDMNKYYLGKKKFKYVHDGSRNLSHNTAIHNFLISKFNFRKAYSKMEIAYRRDIKFVLKLLYPFKSFIYKINLSIFKKISVLLKHEEIRQSYE